MRKRWAGLDPEAALRAPPFPPTPEGRADLRYLPLRVEADKRGHFALKGERFRDCDFTGASMAWMLFEHCTFENCVFDRAVMINLSEKGCGFTGCSFMGTDLRLGHLGTDWNNSAPGEYRSVYRDCTIGDLRTAKLGIGDPVFESCRFVFKQLRALDWGCAGFWDCRFEGGFESMSFRDEYADADSRARKGRPPRAGLHRVSFRDARLGWIGLYGRVAVEDVELPADGSAFFADTARMAASEAAILAACPDEPRREAARRHVRLVCGAPAARPLAIVCRTDMLPPKEPQTHEAGRWLYDYLKANHAA